MKWALVSLIVGCTIVSDVLQAGEMRRHGPIKHLSVRALGRTLRILAARPALLLSIACLALSFFAFLALLRIASLSFSVPVTAVTYVGDALLAKWVLREHLNWKRWAGIVMIASGVVLISI